MDPTDARAHVSLGKLLVQQRRYEEARALYEEGSTATGGENHPLQMLWLGRGTTQHSGHPDTCCASADFINSVAQREAFCHMSECRHPVNMHTGIHRCQSFFC